MSNIQIGSNIAEEIIERLESIIYQDWYNANTMLSEDEHKKMYHKIDIEIIEQLNNAIYKEQHIL